MPISLRRPHAAAALTTLAALVLAGCSAQPTASADNLDDILRNNGLADLDARQIVDTLDALPINQRPTDLIASVHPDGLELSDQSGDRRTLPMPPDAFYLALAPYVHSAHDCHFHSLTTCRGEMPDTEVQVTVTDDADQTVISTDAADDATCLTALPLT